MNRAIGAPVSDPARSCGLTPTRRIGDRRSGQFTGSSLFLLDLLTGHEPAVAPERELSQLATPRQATRVGRFSARANNRAAVWDKPRSDNTIGVSRFMESRLLPATVIRRAQAVRQNQTG